MKTEGGLPTQAACPNRLEESNVRWQPMNKVTYLAKAFVFVARKHIVGLDVKPTPHFEPEGLAFFNSIIQIPAFIWNMAAADRPSKQPNT
jgi:hypothetical protein